MAALYPFAVVLAVAGAIWLQRVVPMPRAYRWLSWGGALVFGAILAPTAIRQPSVETLSELVLLITLPLIAVPYQVRLGRLLTSKAASSDAPQRGPGGGRVRSRDRRRR